MASTVTIGGKHIPKWAAYGGVGVVVVGGILYFKNKNGSSGAGSSNSSATDPVTGLPYSEDNQVDPATGLTYLAEAEQYGSVSAAEAAVGAGYGGVGATETAGGSSGEGYGYPTYQTAQGGEAYATNAEWASAVIAALPGITGDSSSDVATAVANYLAGLPLTSTQANDVQVALAEFGPPPTGSYSIVTAGSGSGTTSTGSATSPGSGASTTTTTPATTPAPAPAPAPSNNWHFPAPSGLYAAGAGKGTITVGWQPVVGPQGQHPQSYTVAYGRTSGAQTWKVVTIDTTTALTTQAGMTEYIEVWANGGPVAPPHAGPVKATAGK